MAEILNLEGKTALVSGASRGIGAEIARELAERGAFVYINYNRSEDAARAVKEEIERGGGKAETVKFDVANLEEVGESVKIILKDVKNIDILINNAGLTRDNAFALMKQADWDEVLDTNLRGVFILTKAVIRPMIKARWGRIVNLTSVAGQYGNPGQANYSASKAGVIALTKSIAREFAPRNITVNAVSPGLIDTDMAMSLPDDARETIISKIPCGRMGTPKEVAYAVCFLVSKYADYITGQVISVNGGLYM
ncbi:MAG: 3-oxoacyl-[acyl-carrier-protein] reductase [Deltaproteobacteria bacterium]|uniref:3-oxoacyl-[acyl-carrier-protein] reductase n=1 Tax=Candidatus Zymogenus saltonus TaxID=2844893 RepID=A0A9D8PQZ6_9DELT|nr:3-oxoacyl-[acyl-carrier-protein] reductase [Candidatus Zymogenus saltonus]